jgi:hypothetical protein
MDLCPPAVVYLVLSVITMLATAKGMPVSSLFVNGLFIAVWTFLLNYLCQKGYTALSWVLVLLPIILLIVIMFLLVELTLSTKLSNVASPASGATH